ncbi:MAG: (2Fe-2S)-binding protein [Fimbriimonas sp.]|nr:(2Fe-2S)-binding protein [Fimbriimonas sp.]
MSVEIEVNGIKHKIDAEPETSLLEILRDDLGLTGTKYGCGESQCGACTVLMNGFPIHSCVTQLSDAADSKIVTIEGIEKNGHLHAVQQAFIDEGAMQCGYCVSGMIMAAVGMLNRNPNPNDEEILMRMSGNICRCGSYPRMMAAIKRASRTIRGVK